ncbi:MAG TPA: hypothetical protein VKC60_14390, partial [Opitutaceae bacterium]|nr:hypothetical protein [Opitutaceae bacterium]
GRMASLPILAEGDAGSISLVGVYGDDLDASLVQKKIELANGNLRRAILEYNSCFHSGGC